MIKIIYDVNYKLPPLAWIAEVKDGIVNVTCGEKVEINDSFFVEGAWSGNYQDGGFDKAEWFCGTGGIIRNNSIVFSTPTGMHAGLYLINLSNNTVIICNSLPFIMAYAGYEYDPKYIGYETFFHWNTLQGLRNYNKDVHALKIVGKRKVVDYSIKMILFRNITVKSNGEVSVCIKDETKGFDNFEEYRDRLVLAMKSLTKNAQDTARKIQYGVASYISSGYDSACCSAIAKEAGATKVMNFKAKGKYKNDSGVETAKQLGYKNIIVRDVDTYKNRNDFPEIYSISGGDMGVHISYCVFEDECRDHLVYSGQNGDYVYSNKNRPIFQRVNDDIHIIWKIAEVDLWEAHIHEGYIPVPMTSFGIRHWSDLDRISNSPEMQKWSIGGDYDRPIPRRILEEKGVSRESFGMKKNGGGFYYVYDWKKRLLGRMSRCSADDLNRYIKSNKNFARFSDYIKFVWFNKDMYFNAIAEKLGIKFRVKRPESKIEKINGIPNPFAPRYLIPWAGQRVIEKYKKALMK